MRTKNKPKKPRDQRACQSLNVSNQQLRATNQQLRANEQRLKAEISQRKKAEEKTISLAKFPSENPNPVCRIDSKDNLLYANKTVKELLKRSRLSEKSIFKLFPDGLKGQIGKLLRTGISICDLEKRIGGKVYSYGVSSVKDQGYINIYALDITARRMTCHSRIS